MFICSKESDESLTTMALREDLDGFVLAFVTFNRCAPFASPPGATEGEDG
jgi:hypothetical protein